MKIIDCSSHQAPLVDATYQTCLRNGRSITEESALQHEHQLSILVNGRMAYTLVCTPEHLLELALGRLFSEGVIESTTDVASVHVCQHGDVVKVSLTHPRPSSSTEPAHISTCNAIREAHLAFRSHTNLEPMEAKPFNRRWIFAAADAFSRDTPMHRRTRGAHSCFLIRSGKVLFCSEDLGRHNAFDKAVGWALYHNVNMSRCMAVTSGRIPSDMAAKAIRARIPVLLSASVPTDEALSLARAKNLTLIGRIKANEVTVFHDPANSMTPAMSAHILQTPHIHRGTLSA